MKFLGVDYGDRRVGLACSDSGVIATALKVIAVKSMREAIDGAASEAERLNVDVIVVGMPYNLDGTEGERAQKTRAFGRVLGKVTGKRVEYFDERLTTVEADGYMAEAGIRADKRKAIIDKVAAKIILQSYLDDNNRKSKE